MTVQQDEAFRFSVAAGSEKPAHLPKQADVARTPSLSQDQVQPQSALRERWRYPLPAAHSLASGDLDGDGKAEIVVGQEKKAVVLDRRGHSLWTFPLNVQTDYLDYLIVARTPRAARLISFDVWGEGVEARDIHGKRLWKDTAENSGVDWVCPVDIHTPDGDAIAIGYNGGGGVRLLQADGTQRWHVKGTGNVWSVAAAHLQPGAPASVLCAQGSIWVYNAQGQKTQEIGTDADAGAVYGADLDGDGVDEVLGLGTTQVSGSYLSVYDAGGKRRWKQQIRTRAAFLPAPILVGHFGPSGSQIAVGAADGTVVLFEANGKPFSYLKVAPDLRAFTILPQGAGSQDALVALTSQGVICYTWQEGKASPIPTWLLVPPPEPPLIQAILNNNLVSVKARLARGDNPNGRSRQGSQALLIAVKEGSLPLVQLLLDRGATINARSRSDSTPLLEAVTGGHRDIVNLLLSRGADVQECYTKGYLVGFTPLMVAAMEGRTEIAQVLLAKGANVHAQTYHGTALHWAVSEGHVSIAELLLAHGARVDARDWFGGTPLMYAAQGGKSEMVEFLIAHGANVNARDDKTRRLYGKAQFIGDKKAQKQIEKSGKLKTLHEDGGSILEHAKIGEQRTIIQRLKQAGAKE